MKTFDYLLLAILPIAAYASEMKVSEEDYKYYFINGNEKKIQQLINTNNLKYLRGYKDREYFYVACKKGYKRILEKLLEYKGNTNDDKVNGKRNFLWLKSITLLHIAALKGHLPIVKMLVEKYKADVNCKSSNEENILHFLSSKGSFEIFQYLVQRGADVNCRDNDGETLLYCASWHGRLEVVKYLVEEKGLEVNVKDKEGNTPLHCASSNGNLEVVKYLVQKGAYINVKDKEGNTPLHCASGSRELEVVRYLDDKKDKEIDKLKRSIFCAKVAGASTVSTLVVLSVVLLSFRQETCLK